MFPFELKTQITIQDKTSSIILWKYNILQDQKVYKDNLVLTGIDITSYDEINKKLQEIGEKYRTLIHVSPVAVFSLGNNLKVKSWSSAAEKLFGWTEKSMLENCIFHAFDEEEGGFKKSCEKALEGTITNKLEFACRKKDGTKIFISLYLAPTRDYNGIIEGIVLIAFDITEQKQAEQLISYQLKVEKLIADISSYLANLPSKSISEGIEEVLKMTGIFLGADSGYVFQFSEDGRTRTMSHEWRKYNLLPLKNELKDHSLDQLPWWYSNIKSRKWINVSNLEDLPPEAEREKKLFKKQNVGSFICIPLVIENSLLGALGFDRYYYKRIWKKEELKLISVVGELIANAFARYEAYLKISYMSFHDQLTGLYNRHFLKEEMQRVDAARQLPLTILIVDLNGLKLVNDTYGHIKGDELLVKAASVLKQSCREEDVIARWGGDEFMILLPKHPYKKQIQCGRE